MKILKYPKSIIGLAIGVAALSFADIATAHPYASGITNTGGAIQFFLNENAGTLSVVLTNIGTGQTTTLNATTTNSTLPSTIGTNVGPQFFSLTQGAVTYSNYSIIVSKIGTGVPAQLSVDTNNFVKFLTPRGVSVNMNPKNHYFGRVYVVNSTPGTGSGRAVGRGMYMLNADLTDALGRGNTASTGGVTFNAASSSSPLKLGVGPDNQVYVNDFSTANATTWMYDPDMNTGTLLLSGVGETSNPNVHTDSSGTPVVGGSLATGNLTLWNYDGNAAGDGASWLPNSDLLYKIGSGPLPWNTAPDLVIGDAQGIPSVGDLTSDVEIEGLGNANTNGYLVSMVDRSAGTDVDSIEIFDTNSNTKIWGSLSTSQAMGSSFDLCRNSTAIMISPDGKYLAMERADSTINIAPLTNGIPDLPNLFTVTFGVVTTGRDIAWDAADNLYSVSSGQLLLREYSLGLTTTCITANDATTTNGTFALVTPSTAVNVSEDTNLITEAGLDSAHFTITRTATDISSPLVVNFTLGGSAVMSSNYSTTATNTVTIPAGQSNVVITVKALEDHVSDPTLGIILTLKGGGGYSAVSPFSQQVVIADDGPEVLAVSATTENTMYEGTTNDYVLFNVTRLGDTNNSGNSFAFNNVVFGGDAIPGVDFVAAQPSLTFDPGVTNLTFQVFPLHNPIHTTNKTFTVAIGAGTGYTPKAGTATATIIDADYAPETVLFADNLGTDTSSSWTLRFAANNGIQDYEMTFGYDATQDGVVPAPNGSNNVLKITVNKDDSTPNGAAGLNLYPNGRTFSGNYAMRFNMNLVQNSVVSTTEFALFGINNSGLKTNWFIETGDFTQIVPVDCDGYWYSIVADASGSSPADYTLFSSGSPTNGPTILSTASAQTFTNQFKDPPFSSGGGAGSPGNIFGGSTNTWCDVEIRKYGDLVRLMINKTTIFNTVNTTTNQSGNIMLGYTDPYASIGSAGGAVYYSNLRVVKLNNPTITKTFINPTNTFNINFTDASGDPGAWFTLQTSTNLAKGVGFVNNAAAITSTGLGTYTTSVAFSRTNAPLFFRIMRNQ